MSTSEITAVRVGQVWADNDKRSAGRHIKVVAIEVLHKQAVVRPCAPNGRLTGARVTRIRLTRLRPTTTGYRLVLDVDDQGEVTTRGSL